MLIGDYISFLPISLPANADDLLVAVGPALGAGKIAKIVDKALHAVIVDEIDNSVVIYESLTH